MLCVTGTDSDSVGGAKAVSVVINAVFNVAVDSANMLGRASFAHAYVKVFVCSENRHRVTPCLSLFRGTHTRAKMHAAAFFCHIIIIFALILDSKRSIYSANICFFFRDFFVILYR